ncbi:hypothetical protein PMAYCL1PPCAC_29784, partial [Pristionchus mayeri]
DDEEMWRKYMDEDDEDDDDDDEEEEGEGEDDKPGSSGLQKGEERNKMALVDSESANVRVLRSHSSKDKKELMEMSEEWRTRKGNRLKNMKTDDDNSGKEEKSEKDLPKRKRCMSDPSSEVPKKTSSSPSNDRSFTNLTEDDIRILEMFADSDLTEDDVEVVKGKKEKKKR